MPTGLLSLDSLGGRVVFSAAAPASGRELWASDGTAAGTVELTAFLPARPFANFPLPIVLAAFDGSVLFAGDDGEHGYEVWVSDGTAAGTRRISDICPGACSPAGIGVAEQAGSILYFPADDGVHGNELWASDGTLAGTRQVADLCPGCGAEISPLGEVGGELLFMTGGASCGRPTARPAAPCWWRTPRRGASTPCRAI